MENWAKELARRVQGQRNQRASNDTGFLVETQRLKAEFGSGLWGQIVNEIKNGCGEMNNELGGGVAAIVEDNKNEIQVRNTDTSSRKLTATFDEGGAQIAWTVNPLSSGGSSHVRYEVRVDQADGRGKLYLLSPTGESQFVAPSTATEIVRHMMSRLFEN